MFFTYILQSLKDSKYYIGHTSNLDKRLAKHNSGLVKSTKNRRPFILVYTESFSSKNDAYKREFEIKRMKGGRQFKELLNKSNGHRLAGSRSAG